MGSGKGKAREPGSITRPVAHLEIHDGGRVRTHLLGVETTIGRAVGNDIQILDLRSSKVHARIEWRAEGYVLADEDSTNGTRVNGEPARQAVLADRDVFEIGDVRFVFTLDQPAPGRARPVRRPTKTPGTPAPATPPAPQAAPESPADLATTCAKLRRILAGNAQLLVERNLKRLLETILDSGIEIVGAERGFIILAEGHSASGVAAARNFDGESLKRPAEKFSHSIAQEVLSTGDGLLLANAAADERFSASMSVAELELRSILCAPIKVLEAEGERTLGVLYVDNRFSAAAFTPADLALLEALGQQAAIALVNARLFEAERRARTELAESQRRLEEQSRTLAAKVDAQRMELAELRSKEGSKRSERKHAYEEIVGESAAMQQVFDTLDRVVSSHVPVLIHGESGTGKELIARAIHYNGPRKTRNFVTVNCAAISETLLESELFGHVRGAFTDAHADKPGLFELADGGTIFLDEIADMSPAMQRKLLRVLQEGEVRRVGGKRTMHVDVRVIAASNRALRDLIRTGEFREDLYYRLNVITVTLPRLSERREDIPALVEHILRRIAKEGGGERTLTRTALAALERYAWPGNIRELENELRRAAALSDEVIDLETLSLEVQNAGPASPSGAPASAQPILPAGMALKDLVKAQTTELERQVIAQVLAECGWRKQEAAARLQLSRPTLDAKIEALGLSPASGDPRP